MVSIIMPLYNAENFLEETIESIRKQSYKDFELICIDDASEDSTISIVENAMLQDKRIKLYHNDVRSGAAVSRNKGLKYAKGEYIAFLDGDDIFEEDMLERAYNLAKQHMLDVVMYEYLHVDSEKIYEKRVISRHESYKRKYCSKPFNILDLSPEDYILLSNSPCNKLFKKEFIDKNGIKFQTLTSSNDVYFVEMSFMFAERIMFLDDERVMLYAREHSTPTRISYDRDPMCTYYASYKVLEEIVKRNKMEEFGNYFYLKCYFILLSGLSKAKTEEKKQMFCEFLKLEGIKKLKEIGGEAYKRLPSDVKENLEQFENKVGNTKWFEYENKVSYFMRKAEQKIVKLFENNNQVVVWGSGNYGRSLIKFVENHGLELAAVIDKDRNKQGKELLNYIISDDNMVDFKKIDVVIVAVKGAYEDVKRTLKNYELEIVSIEKIIEKL